MTERNDRNFSEQMSLVCDRLVGVFSPKAAFRRAQFRAAYEALDQSRIRKKRSGMGGTGDSQLTGANLSQLREIHRDYMRNNPQIEGMLLTALDEIFGEEVKVQAQTDDSSWNEQAEQLWQDEMVNKPCDVTGRFNINQAHGLQYLGCLRDGDSFIVYLDDALQLIEGDQVGTPYGGVAAQNYDVVNGIAYSKQTGRVIGYYIGQPDRKDSCYIRAESYCQYLAEQVHHVFSPQRVSQSRGEPILKAAIPQIDQLGKYFEAELIGACVNAAFALYVTSKDASNIPPAFTGGISSTGEDESGNKLEKMEPGVIQYLKTGEAIAGVGMERPNQNFNIFVDRISAYIGRPLALPLMLITGDYSGATFMNSRIALQQAQSRWRREQGWVLVPMISRTWRWHVDRMILQGKLTQREDAYKHLVQCRRWPYVNPSAEADADKTQLENRTTTRRDICARQGTNYEDIVKQLEKEGGPPTKGDEDAISE
jgi:lambda family phage portal protein